MSPTRSMRPYMVHPGGGLAAPLAALGTIHKISSTLTTGRLAVIEHTLAPRQLGVPMHRHWREDELSIVIAGTLGALLDEQEVTCQRRVLSVETPGTMAYVLERGRHRSAVHRAAGPGRAGRVLSRAVAAADGCRLPRTVRGRCPGRRLRPRVRLPADRPHLRAIRFDLWGRTCGGRQVWSGCRMKHAKDTAPLDRYQTRGPRPGMSSENISTESLWPIAIVIGLMFLWYCSSWNTRASSILSTASSSGGNQPRPNDRSRPGDETATRDPVGKGGNIPSLPARPCSNGDGAR